MHKHLLDILGGLDEGTVGQILEVADFDRFSRVSPVLYANYLKSVGRP